MTVVAPTPEGGRPDGDDSAEVDSGSSEALGGARGDDSVELVAWRHWLDLGSAGGDDNLHPCRGIGRMHVHHAARCPHDNQRTRIDADDFFSPARVESQESLVARLRVDFGRRRAAGLTLAHHNNVAVHVSHGHAPGVRLAGRLAKG